MSRYSADTVSGQYTLELGRFGQRPYYPGADSVSLALQLKNGTHTKITIPWAAKFVASGNDTASFIAETCLPATNTTEKRAVEKKRATSLTASPLLDRLHAVVDAGSQDAMRQAAVQSSSFAGSANPVTPNRASSTLELLLFLTLISCAQSLPSATLLPSIFTNSRRIQRLASCTSNNLSHRMVPMHKPISLASVRSYTTVSPNLKLLALRKSSLTSQAIVVVSSLLAPFRCGLYGPRISTPVSPLSSVTMI
jgi:hypothetical protein